MFTEIVVNLCEIDIRPNVSKYASAGCHMPYELSISLHMQIYRNSEVLQQKRRQPRKHVYKAIV